MSAFRNLTGRRFGRLTVIGFSHMDKTSRWFCRCDCGTEIVVRGAYLTFGKTSACIYCDKRWWKHGHHRRGKSSPTYGSWTAMKSRCYRASSQGFKYYGGRGIGVCDRWRWNFENFLADMGERPSGLTLDRIDNNGNYEPGNCRWVTRAEQNRTKRHGGGGRKGQPAFALGVRLRYETTLNSGASGAVE